MLLEILEAPDGAMIITTFDVFKHVRKAIEVPNDPFPETRGDYLLPLTVRIVEGDRRDAGLLVHAGYKIAIDAIVT